MTEVVKRRATERERVVACALGNVDPEEVLEVWVTDDGPIEIVMRGAIDRINVNVEVSA